MKIIIFPFLAFMIICQFAISQTDTLNLLDANNKKVGWWKIFVDKDLAVTDDPTKAKYYRYAYFDGKFDYFNISRIGTKRNPVLVPTSGKTDLKIIPLNGEYRANFKNGKTRFILIAVNGRLEEYKEFYKNGNTKHVFKYTEQCGDTPFYYCIYLYKNDGTLKAQATLKSPKK